MGESHEMQRARGGEGMEPRFSNSDLSLDLNGCSREGEGRAQIPVCLKTVSKKLVILLHIQVWQDWKAGALVSLCDSCLFHPDPVSTHWLSKRPLRSLCERQPGPSPSPTGRGYTSCKILDMQSRGHTEGEKCVTGVSGPVRQIVASWRSWRRSEDKVRIM